MFEYNMNISVRDDQISFTVYHNKRFSINEIEDIIKSQFGEDLYNTYTWQITDYLVERLGFSLNK